MAGAQAEQGGSAVRWVIRYDAGRLRSQSVLRRSSRASFAVWERWSASMGGVGLLSVWAIAEATVWPILPDFLLVPLVLGKPINAARLLAGAIAGMALGGAGIYLFAFQQPADALSLLHHLPTVHADAVNRAGQDLAAHGLAAFLYQPVSGVPFKVWALLAGSEGRSPLRAIPLFVLARGTRMAVLAVTARMIGARFRPFLGDYFLLGATIYLGAFFYVWWRLINA